MTLTYLKENCGWVKGSLDFGLRSLILGLRSSTFGQKTGNAEIDCEEDESSAESRSTIKDRSPKSDVVRFPDVSGQP